MEGYYILKGNTLWAREQFDPGMGSPDALPSRDTLAAPRQEGLTSPSLKQL